MHATKIIPVIALLLFALTGTAQYSNMVVFTQANLPFTIILNGIQQSPDPETNVKITGLDAPSYRLKVLFENTSMPAIEKTVYLQPETEVTYEILKNNKAVWVLRMLNSIPLDEIIPPGKDQNVFIFTTSPRLSTTTVSQTTTVSTVGLPGGTSITTTTTRTTSNVNGYGDPGDHGSDSGNGKGYGEHGDHNDYSGPRGCPKPMGNTSFDQAMESISAKSFESSKLTIAKQIAGSNCLRCKQVREIMKLFTFESNRLEFAKYAYTHTWDIDNYFMLNDAFEFESSIDDLNTYIQDKR